MSYLQEQENRSPELTTFEICLGTSIKRIQTHSADSQLPRPGLPDFSHESTYAYTVHLARTLFAGDTEFSSSLSLLPSYKEFKETTAGRYFAGEIPRVDVDDDGKALIGALQTVLNVTGDNDRIHLTVGCDENGPIAGFISYEAYGTLAQEQNREKESYPLSRLREILDDPSDRYWQALIQANDISSELVTQEKLARLKERLLHVPLVSPVRYYTKPEKRGQGVAQALVRKMFGASAVAFDSNKADIFCVLRNALSNHQTVLAPASADLPEEDKLVALALQILPLSVYEKQYQDLVTAHSPAAVDLALFGNISGVTSGVWKLGGVDEVDMYHQAKVLAKNGLVTKREAILFLNPDLGVDTQLAIVAFPKGN